MSSSPLLSFQTTKPKKLFAPNTSIAVLASGDGSNFAAIAHSVSSRELDVTLVGLICNRPDAAVIEIAKKQNIPVAIINHKDFDSREDFDQALVDQLKSWSVDLVIMAGWMRIATPTLIDPFKDRILNIHPSLLPSFKGRDAIEQAHRAGVTIMGCTVHVVEPEIDSGEIVAQAAFPTSSVDSLAITSRFMHKLEHQLYPAAIRYYLALHQYE